MAPVLATNHGIASVRRAAGSHHCSRGATRPSPLAGQPPCSDHIRKLAQVSAPGPRPCQQAPTLRRLSIALLLIVAKDFRNGTAA